MRVIKLNHAVNLPKTKQNNELNMGIKPQYKYQQVLKNRNATFASNLTHMNNKFAVF